METMSTPEDVSRIRVKFLIEGLGEAEGELVRFMAPRTIDTIVRKLPVEGRAASKPDGRDRRDSVLANECCIMHLLWEIATL
jgi:hypothetical protein